MKKFLLILTILLSFSGLCAAAEPQVAAENAVLSSFFESRAKEVEALRQEVQGLKEQLDTHKDDIKAALETARARLQTLEVMARMVKTNPYDMRVALAEARYLQGSMTKNFQPLETLAKDLGTKIVTVQALEEDLERKWSMGLDKEVRQEVQGIRKSAATLAQTLKGVQEQVDKVRGEVAEIQARTDEWVETFETQLPQIWRAEFLDPAEFRLLPKSGVDIGQELTEWFSSLKSFFISQYSLTGAAGDWAGTFVLFWIPFVFIGFVAYRFLSGVFENNYAGGRLTSAFGILCLSLGLSLLAAFFSGKVKQTSLLLACTHVLMLLGVQALAWVFRNVRGVLRHRSLQPLLPLVFLSLSVTVLDLLRLPQWMEHLTWVGLLVLSSLFFGMIRPELRYERIVRWLHPFVMAILVVVAILGWGKPRRAGQHHVGRFGPGVSAGHRRNERGHGRHREVRQEGLARPVDGPGRDLPDPFDLGGRNHRHHDLGQRQPGHQRPHGQALLPGTQLGGLFLQLHAAGHGAAPVSGRAFPGHGLENGFGQRKPALEEHRPRRGRVPAAHRHLLPVDALRPGQPQPSGHQPDQLRGHRRWPFRGYRLRHADHHQQLHQRPHPAFDRAIQPGDIIEVNGIWAKVMSVNIRNTEVQTFDNAKIFLPNSTLIANQVTNWTHRNDVRIRRDVLVGVAYGSDVQLVKSILLEAASEHPAVMSTSGAFCPLQRLRSQLPGLHPAFLGAPRGFRAYVVLGDPRGHRRQVPRTRRGDPLPADGRAHAPRRRGGESPAGRLTFPLIEMPQGRPLSEGGPFLLWRPGRGARLFSGVFLTDELKGISL